jgi:hypothetical protein
MANGKNDDVETEPLFSFLTIISIQNLAPIVQFECRKECRPKLRVAHSNYNQTLFFRVWDRPQGDKVRDTDPRLMSTMRNASIAAPTFASVPCDVRDARSHGSLSRDAQ